MASSGRLALLTTDELRRVTTRAGELGVPLKNLVAAAGAALAEAICRRWSPRPVSVLVGPGNNGSDALAAAKRLSESGWPVRIGVIDGRMTTSESGPLGRDEPLFPRILNGAGLVIDALLSTSLARPTADQALEMIEAVAASGLPVCSVDVPSGVHPDSGATQGASARANLTVAFSRKRIGHVLFPGRWLCGDILVREIGIPAAAFDAVRPRAFENDPLLWAARFPWPDHRSHKYTRGNLVVLGGSTLTGAARLAARAGARVGAGLVTIAVPPAAWPVYSASVTSIIAIPISGDSDFANLVADTRNNAFIIGPGLGTAPEVQSRIRSVLTAGRALVIDADAISAFSQEPEMLFESTNGRPVVLTPHEGEFTRLFGRTAGDRLERAREAARRSGAIVLFKGPDTVVARPDGLAVVGTNAPPDLATAGTGDVLAGLVGGLLALGLDPFDAACAAVWLHGAAASRIGPGLIAEDIPEAIPSVLRDLQTNSNRE